MAQTTLRSCQIQTQPQHPPPTSLHFLRSWLYSSQDNRLMLLHVYEPRSSNNGVAHPRPPEALASHGDRGIAVALGCFPLAAEHCCPIQRSCINHSSEEACQAATSRKPFNLGSSSAANRKNSVRQQTLYFTTSAPLVQLTQGNCSFLRNFFPP